MNIIQDTKKAIEEKKKQLIGKQSQKKSALQNQRSQMSELANQKKEKDAVVNRLKSQEKDLAKEIAAKRKRDNALKGQIAAIVRREIEAEQKAERNRLAALKKTETTTAPGTTTSKPATPKRREEYLTLNEGQKAMAAKFENNKGGLPWPVDNGYVSIPFGTSKIGGLVMDNPGLTISTPSAGVSVKAVFDGEVSAVSNLGDGMMVMIRHGKYFTVYSNLSTASVSKGTSVKTGDMIGKAAQADDGTGGQVDFMLMIETKNVNPSPWLRRR